MNNKVRNIILTVLFVVFLSVVYTYDVGFVRTRFQKTIENRKYTMQPVLDKSITNRINNEDNIKNAYVYVNSYVAFAPIIVEDNFNPNDAKILGEKYTQVLVKKYSDKEINVKIVTNDGKILYENSTKKQMEIGSVLQLNSNYSIFYCNKM